MSSRRPPAAAAASPSAFPFTKLLVFLTLGLIVTSRMLASRAKSSAPSSVAYVVVAHALTYPSLGEALLAALVLYQLRVMEVACGPSKYGGLVVCCGLIGYGLEAVLGRLVDVSGASGLHPVIFSLLVGYFLDVPRQSRFSLFGVGLSDKSFLYGMAGWLAVVHGGRSLLSAGRRVIGRCLYWGSGVLQRVAVPEGLVAWL